MGPPVTAETYTPPDCERVYVHAPAPTRTLAPLCWYGEQRADGAGDRTAATVVTARALMRCPAVDHLFALLYPALQCPDCLGWLRA